MTTSETKYQKTLLVGVNLDNLVKPIDPLNNATLTNAFFSNNLYSNLVDIDSGNKYILDLASNYWFENANKKIKFEFENSRINAADAAFSLKWVILQKLNLHSDLWQIICESGESRDFCQKRIFVENNTLVIEYDNADLVSSIIPTLASVDYKIIPTSAFDSTDPAIAKVINYTETSGHYYLEIINQKYHLRKSSKSNLKSIYTNFELVNTNPAKLQDDPKMLENLDIISSTVPLTEVVMQRLNSLNWNIFKSHNISVAMLVFSNNGRNKTTVQQRFTVAQIISTELQKNIIANSKQTVEFFQDFGQGFLYADQIQNIESLRNSNVLTPKGLTLGVRTPSRWSSFEKEHPELKIVGLQTAGTSLSEEEKPDIFLITNDVSFDLNLSLISYAKNLGILQMSDEQLFEFIKMKDEAKKVEFINNIHYQTLKDCLIYPLWTSPYFSGFKENCDHDLSKFNSRTLLWKIH